jgi:putative DNA-invertase from lambdoid prophage Rac
MPKSNWENTLRIVAEAAKELGIDVGDKVRALRSMVATAQTQAEATKSAQRAGIDHSRMVKPSAYLGRKPSYDRATFDRIRLALDAASPPSLSAMAKAERLSKQTVFRLKQEAALDAWGVMTVFRSIVAAFGRASCSPSCI